MPKQITIDAYEYDELCDEAKSKARDWFREGTDCSDTISKSYRQTLGYLQYPVSDICFSLGYCQGDGMAFYGDISLADFFSYDGPSRIECKDYTPEFALKEDDLQHVMELLTRCRVLGVRLFAEPLLDLCSCKITRNDFGHRYSHWNTMKVSIDCNVWPEDAEHEADIVALLDDVQSWMQDDVKHVSKVLEKQGYAEIEYVHSDEYLEEGIKVNEYLFTVDGKRSFVL